MSIHIGLVPLIQNSNDVFTIYSSKSNVINIQSLSNNVFMDIGDYKLGQRSNEPFVFSHKNSNIITYDSTIIAFNREVVANSNLRIRGSLNAINDISCSNLSASNIVIGHDIVNGYKIIDCRSNNIETFNVINDDRGVGYVGGRIGIGVKAIDKQYSLVTSSNINVNGDIYGNKVITKTIIVSSNNVQGEIFFDENKMVINAASVKVNNLVLGGDLTFADLSCIGIADMSGLLLASNVSIFNNNPRRNPFKINQRLIDFDYGNNISGNPISVLSQHKGIVQEPTIMELSSCGNLILGDFPSTSRVDNINIINDYVIRGNIPTNREIHFKGYLHFSSNRSENTIFNVNKSGQLSIGSSTPEALLDITNGFTGYEANYVKPHSIAYLRNNNTSNELPFLKCENSNVIKFQITSNATVCFNDQPVNIYKYNIESGNNYLTNIDTVKIASYKTDGIIDMSYSTLSNVNTMYSSNLRTSNMYVNNISAKDCYIENLQVGSFSTSSFGATNSSIFAIDNDHLVFSGSNIVISKDTTIIDNPPSYVNHHVDKLIIKTETSTENANGYTIFGNNKSITLLCKNESTIRDSSVIYELQNSVGGFAIMSQLVTVGVPPELYITSLNSSGNPYAFPAITLYNDKTVYLRNNLFAKIDRPFINSDNGRQPKSVNIGDGVLVYTSTNSDSSKYLCVTTNEYGSLDTGRGISAVGGPFNKQGGWVNVSGGIYIIQNSEYGVRNNTSGTIHIQVQGTNKLGNVNVSFLRFSGIPDLFSISYHKSALLQVLTVTAVSSGIQITTDTDCKVCWTSIGSC